MVFEVQCREVADLARLIPAVHQTIADGQPTAGMRDLLLRIDCILPRTFPSFEFETQTRVA